MSPPFLLGAPFTGYPAPEGPPEAPVNLCDPDYVEPSDMSAVSWAGWWTGDYYDGDAEVAYDISGNTRDLGPDHTTIPGDQNPLHNDTDLLNGHCSMEWPEPTFDTEWHGASLQATVSGAELLSRTAFYIATVMWDRQDVFSQGHLIQPLANAGELRIALQKYSGGEHLEFLIRTQVDSTHYQTLLLTLDAGVHYPNSGSLFGVPFLLEIVFDMSEPHVASGPCRRLRARVCNDVEYLSTALADDVLVGDLVDWADSDGNTPGIIPWTYSPDGLLPVAGIGVTKAGPGAFPENAFPEWRIWELAVMPSVPDDATRDAVAAALMTKYALSPWPEPEE